MTSKAVSQVLAIVIVVLVLAVAFIGYGVGTFAHAPQTRTITTQMTVTQTQSPVTLVSTYTTTYLYSTYTTTYSTNSTYVNTFFTNSCVITAGGGFQFRVLSDSTGAPVNPTSAIAVNSVSCNSEPQVVYTNVFLYLGGGWYAPVLPTQATYAGGFTVTLTYAGKTYNFSGAGAPIGTDCITLHVPSGNMSALTSMSGC